MSLLNTSSHRNRKLFISTLPSPGLKIVLCLNENGPFIRTDLNSMNERSLRRLHLFAFSIHRDFGEASINITSTTIHRNI